MLAWLIRWFCVEDEQFRILMKRLDAVSRLLAIIAAKNLSFREQVRFLSYAGLSPSEIATVLGKSANNVRVTLSAIRKSKE